MKHLSLFALLTGLWLLTSGLCSAATATATVGNTVTISVANDGTPPFTYQWRKDGVDLTGATSATLILAAVTKADAGAYSVRVANDAGSIVSDDAVLTVKGLPPTKATTTITLNVSLDLKINTTTALVYQP